MPYEFVMAGLFVMFTVVDMGLSPYEICN